MLKHITVNIVVDDRYPEKCGDRCNEKCLRDGRAYCDFFFTYIYDNARCWRCLREAK